MAGRANGFQTIRSEGGLLPPDLLRRVLDPKAKLPGTLPEDYGLPRGERLNEVITQSWNRLRKHWVEFRVTVANLPEGEPATGVTNDKWSLPLLRELGFGLLPTSPSPEIGGRTYAINRFFGPVPLHLIGCGLSLERRAAGVRGAAAANPHGLLQEFLNRSPAHMWGVVANGLRLRVLRDNQALSRQSFLEFDLEAMFAGEVYSDFVLLWLVVHATRFAPREGDRPETCWLEEWARLADEQGTRVLGDLRGGVERALQVLGEGFTSHPKNAALRDALRGGQVSPTDFHGQLLRVVYRLIFLFVAEDRLLEGRPLLHPIDDSDAARIARERYEAHYSAARLRELASKIKGSRHGDLWRQFQIVVRALSGEPGYAAAREHLALPALGSFLWSPASTAALNDAELSNHDFLEAIRRLAFTRQDKVLRPVDYRNLGAEELGGVYESLLALTPQISADGARFTFAEFAGSERKTSGSYYTPDSLVQCLLDSALDPVVEEAIKGKTGIEAEKAILALKVCDPAVGSGHFLVGAAHRMARHLARVCALAQGESEPSPLLYQHALRDVIGRCLYGVDVNPMAAELCRVSLWLEALEPGKPLSFLDHHIRVGNSLLGATPALLKAGIPDDAFKPIEGDDKEYCKELKKSNRTERRDFESGQQTLFHPWERLGDLATAMVGLDDMPDDTPDAVRKKQERYERLVKSSGYLFGHLWADAWCAAFVMKKIRDRGGGLPYPVTEQVFRAIERNPHSTPPWLKDEVQRLAREYQFFHWHLEFPDVFRVPESDEKPENERTGWSGGFDCVLGNPPWERIKLQEKEFFAARSPEIANAPNAAARRRMIEDLRRTDPALHQAFREALRRAEGESALVRDTGRFPLCGRGDVNTYSIFAEHKRSLLNPSGRVGCIVPSGIATDDTTKFFFQNLTESRSLVSLYDFENAKPIFPGVHRSYKFCLLTLTGAARSHKQAEFVFFAHALEDLADLDRRFTLSAEDIALLNPNTRTCPIFRSRRDAELTKFIYRRVPVLVREARGDEPEENPWGVRFSRMFDMSNDSGLFRTGEQLDADGWTLRGNIFQRNGERYLPLYEAKLFHQFDHRFATYDGNGNGGEATRDVTDAEKADASMVVLPRYWVSEREVEKRLDNGEMSAPAPVDRQTDRQTDRSTTSSWYGSSHEPPTCGQPSAHSYRAAASTTKPQSFNSELDIRLETDYEHDQSADGDRNADLSRRPRPQGSDGSCCRWLAPIRKTARATDERTAIASITPRSGMSDRAPLVHVREAHLSALLTANLNSAVLDFTARTAVGGTDLSYFIIKQLPILLPDAFQQVGPIDRAFIISRVLELTYTAWDLEPFARDLGYEGPPFKWDEERRFLIRCELDAAFFHLYLPSTPDGDWKPARKADGAVVDETPEQLAELKKYFPTPRDAVDYIMETFPIVKRKDEARYGSYRTKETILEIYDAMQAVMAENASAMAAGRQPAARYRTRLNPPPGPPCDAQGNFIPMAQWDRANWPMNIHQPRVAPLGRPGEIDLGQREEGHGQTR